ncbi:Small integral membrane protein 4 [Galemys pyrenaicus]|uniref:Small integral membrane protein 4 n=1 Tax=Galemys pyrenaicus TaxID=202257 RepID=A0A8J6AM74_GALPY|nr:Small integral membrane protein 4 [Galemys pyrenaicus]
MLRVGLTGLTEHAHAAALRLVGPPRRLPEFYPPGCGAGLGSHGAQAAQRGWHRHYPGSPVQGLWQPPSRLLPPYPFSTSRCSMFSRAQVRRVLQRVPGKQRLGVYRFLPFFFVLGGTMEWIMIKVRVGQETFYDVYRRKASERQYQKRLEDASETELQQSIK